MTIWHAPSPITQHRKIELDPQQWKPHSRRQSGGRQDCDHDWAVGEEFGTWKCVDCGMKVTYEHW